MSKLVFMWPHLNKKLENYANNPQTWVIAVINGVFFFNVSFLESIPKWSSCGAMWFSWRHGNLLKGPIIDTKFGTKFGWRKMEALKLWGTISLLYQILSSSWTFLSIVLMVTKSPTYWTSHPRLAKFGVWQFANNSILSPPPTCRRKVGLVDGLWAINPFIHYKLPEA